jgi:hypothetical protein
MASEQLSIQLSSGMRVEIDASDWPLIGEAEWTNRRDGGVVEAHVLVRRHADGRAVIYLDANPGEGPFVKGDLLPTSSSEVEEFVSRFGELHEMPNWVVARCVQSIRG